MPTTTTTDLSATAYFIGNRTDLAGAGVDDAGAEDMRLVAAFHTEGAITTNAFKVAAQSSPNMTVKIGSGTAKTDVYLVPGTASGQKNYFVGMEAASVNQTISASEPASARIDEVYLVVFDAAYDANTAGTAGAAIRRPMIGYRKGDAGGGAPGPDSSWKAYAKLATVAVAAAVTTITNGVITDERPDSSFIGRLGGADLTDIGNVLDAAGGPGHVPMWNGSTGYVHGKPGLFAYTSYHPGSPTTINSASSAGDLDSSNLVVSFNAPYSGAVLVRLSATVGSSSGASLYWLLRQGSSTVTNTTRRIVTNSLDDWDLKTYEVIVTGLTPGVVYEWKWGAYHTGSSVAHALGGTEGPMVMEVFRA